MNKHQESIARACLEGAESDSMSFPQVVAALLEAGFESYAVDFRRGTAAYYLPDGDSIALPIHRVETSIAPQLDASLMQAAVHEAQQQAPGYSYRGFCEKAAAAGCAGYVASFSGRRVLYLGRTAEAYVEPFPN